MQGIRLSIIIFTLIALASVSYISGQTGLCGNNIIDPGEICDKPQTCADVTKTPTSVGTVTCSTDCRSLSISCKMPAVCGDGFLQSGEICDGINFGGKTCINVTGNPLARGNLTCNGCTNISVAGCTVCGNGAIESGEVCDGASFGGKTCASQTGRTDATGSLTCTSCTGVSTSSCVIPSLCGNGIIESGEVCDNSNFGGKTCRNVTGNAAATGSLSCVGCTSVSAANCVLPSVCGNNVIEPGEVCDGASFGGKTCASQTGTSGATGNLACIGCTNITTSNCVIPPVCGNGILDPGEVCDVNNSGGKTCANVTGNPFATGTLSCVGCAAFGIANCVTPICGNGIVEGGEICDGNAFGGQTCTSKTSRPDATGTLTCNTCANISTINCAVPPTCGNGVLDAGETCDGVLFGGFTCTIMTGGKFTAGHLTCDGCFTISAGSCLPSGGPTGAAVRPLFSRPARQVYYPRIVRVVR